MIGALLLILAGVCVAVYDTLAHHYGASVFRKLNPFFWNAEISWRNKYVDGWPDKGRKKWFGLIPVPVALTDGWHLFKSAHTILIIAAMVLAIIFPISGKWYTNAIIYYSAYKLPFTLCYSYLFKKK